MRILHTADWHLGKIVNEFSMLSLQKEYLIKMIQEVKTLEVDAVIIAGDLYDRAIPPKEAVSLANWAFTELTQTLRIPTFVIAGNHDSNERIEYGAELLANSKLFIEGTTKENVRKVTIDGVNFYLCPFDDHRNIREVLGEETIKNPEDALRLQLEQVKKTWKEDEINILLYHGFMVNYHADEELEESDSERPLTIGTAEYVPVELVETFDYVALGHLHKAQKVKHDHIRYSGSPLKYSKSEANHRKQHLLLEISKEDVAIQSLPITLSKDLRVMRGLFDDMMEESSQDYLFFELEDTEFILDAMNRLRNNYPYAMGLEYIHSKEKERLEVHHSKENLKAKSLNELFDDFYTDNIGIPLNEKQTEAVSNVLEEITRIEGER